MPRPEKYPSGPHWWSIPSPEAPASGPYGLYENPFADYGPYMIDGKRVIAMPDINMYGYNTSMPLKFFSSSDEGVTWECAHQSCQTVVDSIYTTSDVLGFFDIEWDPPNGLIYVAKLWQGGISISKFDTRAPANDPEHPAWTAVSPIGPADAAACLYSAPINAGWGRLVYARSGTRHCVAYQTSDDPSTEWGDYGFTKVAVYDEASSSWTLNTVSPVFSALSGHYSSQPTESPCAAFASGDKVHIFSVSGETAYSATPNGLLWHTCLDLGTLSFTSPEIVLPSGTVLASDYVVNWCPVGLFRTSSSGTAFSPVMVMPYGSTFDEALHTEFDLSLLSVSFSSGGSISSASLKLIAECGAANWIGYGASFSNRYSNSQRYFFSRQIGYQPCAAAALDGSDVYIVVSNDEESAATPFSHRSRSYVLFRSSAGGPVAYVSDLLNAPGQLLGPRAFNLLEGTGRIGGTFNYIASNYANAYYELIVSPVAPALAFMPRYIRPRWPKAGA